MKTTTYSYRDDLPVITLVARQGQLLALDWFIQKTEKILNRLAQQAQFVPKDMLTRHQDDDERLLCEVVNQLDEYFLGKRTAFDVKLDLSSGTPFQQTVWCALLDIPYGKTISYGQLARAIGKPSAYRAVANANGRNPISLIIPCHRVIASDGALGGYTGGTDIKRILLDIEHHNA